VLPADLSELRPCRAARHQRDSGRARVFQSTTCV